ncbi:hypothetical protein GCM10017764_30670 [Sphingobacterium griseoflavum]|uniref:Uncharacterized protein n=1 Tax=Sphingobacterium griseoflavum TaxID=1474952 RepID=A0ABQ3I1G7_9SPHI|nr:hypothetical protein GCM10017764_30670 [Sphingobacterium griseoflavum]
MKQIKCTIYLATTVKAYKSKLAMKSHLHLTVIDKNMHLIDILKANLLTHAVKDGYLYANDEGRI